MSYEDINIEEVKISRDKLMEITGGYTVPQIVVNEKSIGGLNALVQLEQSGKLKELLAHN